MQSDQTFHRFTRQGIPCGPAGPPMAGAGVMTAQSGSSFAGFQRGPGRWGEATRPVSGVVYDSSKILSEQHYHHGDHHHHHHQRHLHHFHDLHLVTEATETMDLRNTPQVDTKVIASENGPMEMHLRPDLVGRMVFENGAEQYGFGVQYRVDEGPMRPASPVSPMAMGGEMGYSAAAAGGYCGVMEEELYHRRSSR